MKPRLILADDHRIVAEGIKCLLVGDFDVVAIVEDGTALLEAARKFTPDVIVSDITMPHLNGVDALVMLRKLGCTARVIFLTMHHSAVYARRAVEAGASGFVLKHSAPAELTAAIRLALAGKTFLSPAIAEEVSRSRRQNPSPFEDPARRVTARQRHILQLLAEGRSAKEIGSALGISSRTVEFHKYRMMDMLGLESSAELIHFAIRQGVIAN